MKESKKETEKKKEDAFVDIMSYNALNNNVICFVVYFIPVDGLLAKHLGASTVTELLARLKHVDLLKFKASHKGRDGVELGVVALLDNSPSRFFEGYDLSRNTTGLYWFMYAQYEHIKQYVAACKEMLEKQTKGISKYIKQDPASKDIKLHFASSTTNSYYSKQYLYRTTSHKFDDTDYAEEFELFLLKPTRKELELWEGCINLDDFIEELDAAYAELVATVDGTHYLYFIMTFKINE